MPRRRTRGENACRWVEEWCVLKGRPVEPSPEERAVIYCIYDHPDGLQRIPVGGRLAACLTLLHIVGPEAKLGGPPSWFATDIF
jgi:hypothetical protein